MITGPGYTEYQLDDETKVVAKTLIYLELSEQKTRDALKYGDIKDRKIRYMGRNLLLCRTDYKDGICTYPENAWKLCDDKLREFYLSKVGVRGARVFGTVFAVIDAESDG